MKRLLSLILAVFMLISLVPANSFAESNVDDAIVPETVEDESVQTVVEESENNPQEIDIIVESSEKTEEKSEDDAPEESGEAEPLSEESEKAETLSEESEEAENITLMKNSSSELENIGECIGFVRVTVENTTFSMTNGAAWDGILIDTPVNLYTGSTMMSCVIDALGDISQTGAESNYITEINGLNAGDGGYMSGWMGTLNDWFTNEGFDSFTVSAGTLQNGDEICILYTCDFGPDCGGDWSNNDKTLAALSFGAGELCPAFDSSIHEYTLIVPSGTTGITVLPVAANKNFQVHTFVGETEYKRCAAVPISDGSVISIIDGDPLWPSMNGGDYGEADSVPAEEYNVTVVYESSVNAFVRAQTAGAYIYGIDSAVNVSSSEAERFGYIDNVSGVSALDALVVAHKLIFDDLFTPETAELFLNLDDSGFISVIFGIDTIANGFMLNGGYPNDGTPSTSGGYNGTTVTTQQIYDGDVLDFFTYCDTDYSDIFTFISVSDPIYAGMDFAVAVKGNCYAWNGYLYADAASFASAATAAEGCSLAWVNAQTGEVSVISGIVTDEDGMAIITAPAEAGSYLLTAVGDNEYTFCILNPAAINVIPQPAALSSGIEIRTSNSTSDLSNAILAGENELGIAVFDSEIHEYYLGAPLTDAISQLRFYFDLGFAGAKVMLYWNDANGAEKSKDITKSSARFANCLHVGENTLRLEFTIPGNIYPIIENYTFNVVCKPTITALNIFSGNTILYLDKDFDPNVNNYELTLPASAQSVSLEALAKNADYTVLFNGMSSGLLNTGMDSIALAVISADGTTNIYTLMIKTVQQLDLIVVPSPADAIVKVYDHTGHELEQSADGRYSGLFSEYPYSYTVTKYGYVAVKDVVPSIGGKLEVILSPAPASTIENVDSEWNSFRGNDNNMGITDEQLPISENDTELIWAKKLGSGWVDSPSVQIIADNSLIVMSGTTIYKLSLDSGEIKAQSEMVSTPSYGYTPPTYAEGMIFCPLGGGTVQAFNAHTLESLWVYTDILGGQALSPIVYSDGYIYTGFWTSYTDYASYICLSVTDEDPAQMFEEKQASWRFVNAGGYYWAGALSIGKAVIFGSEDGIKTTQGSPYLYSIDKLTGQPISIVELSGVGDIRSTIAYDSESGRIFFTTADGYLCSAVVDALSGEISDVKCVYYNAKSTSTPVVYNGRVYFGTGSGISTSGSSGNFVVADADSLKMINYIGLKGYPQCSALLSTAHEYEGYLCFYCTYNAKPGGISLIKVNIQDAMMDLIELYDAQGYEQYCITSLICGNDGTIYYKNDSGNIMAVGFSAPARVRRLIDAIGTVTADSADAIAAATGAYSILSEDDKAKVPNYALLKEATETYEDMLGNIAAAELSIDSTGTVSADSGEAIRNAREKYDALSESEKNSVSNYSALQAAEAAYEAIFEVIDEVEKKIAAIGTVSTASAAAIAEARNAYDALPAASKKYVSNLASLTTAETNLSQLNKSKNVMDLISAIGTVNSQSEAKISAARKAYNALSSEEKTLVSNYSILTAAEAKLASLSGSSKGGTVTTKTVTTSTTSTAKTTAAASEKTTVDINGKKYTVNKRSAQLMEQICALAGKESVTEKELIAVYRIYAALSDELKKEVYNYSDLEAMLYELGKKNHRDDANEIEAEGLSWSEKLSVSPIENGTEYGYVLGSIGQNKLLKMYRISCADILSGQTPATDRDILLCIPAISAAEITGYRLIFCSNDMQLSYPSFTEKNGQLCLSYIGSGIYALVGICPGEKLDDAGEESGNIIGDDTKEATVTLPLVWIASGGASVAVLLSVLIIKLLKQRR